MTLNKYDIKNNQVNPVEVFHAVLLQKWQQLIGVGERCLGEHHSQVLARQRDTIAHIREQLQERHCSDTPTGPTEP